MKNNDFNEELLDSLNEEFDKYQETLSLKDKRIRYKTTIDVKDDFFKMIDDLCGTEISSY